MTAPVRFAATALSSLRDEAGKPSSPSGLQSAGAGVLDAIDTLLANETPAVRWLRKAGPIAARLNAEAEKDA